MSLVKGARNLAAAKQFYEWALTPSAQALGAATLQFQLPSNKETKVDARVPDFKKSNSSTMTTPSMDRAQNVSV